MDITSKKSDNELVITLTGALDLTTATLLDNELLLEGIDRLVLDFAHCHHVSSVGLRVLLRAHKQMSTGDRKMNLINVSRDVHGIFDLTGLTKILAVKQKMREISIEGLQMISEGVCGECFQLDKETVVKLYREGVEPIVAENEKQYAKAAFVMGIPTAISYDVVSCGTRTGIVFEMLNAELFSHVIKKDFANVDKHAKTLSDLAKTLHVSKGDPAILPNMKESFRGYIRKMDDFLSPEEVDFLMQKLESIPDCDTCVHFDLHSSNIMIQNGEPVIIDMGDLSIGSYLFDVGLVFAIYGVEELGLSMRATKLPVAQGLELWSKFHEHFFADKSEQERAFFHENRYFLGSLRFVCAANFLPKMRGEFVPMIKNVFIPKMMGK